MPSVREYEIRIKRSAAKELENVPLRDRQRIAHAINGLRHVPRPANVEKLSGMDNHFRIRSGDYRIIYSIEDAVLSVLVIRIGHRKDVYQKLK